MKSFKVFLFLFCLISSVNDSFAVLSSEEEEALNYINMVRQTLSVSEEAQQQTGNPPVNLIRIKKILNLSDKAEIAPALLSTALEDGKNLQCLAWILENVEEDLEKARKNGNNVQKTPKKDHIAKQLASMVEQEASHKSKLGIYTAINSDLDALYEVIRQVKSLLKMEMIQLGFRCSESQEDVFKKHQSAKSFHSPFQLKWDNAQNRQGLVRALNGELLDHQPEYIKHFICGSVSPFSCAHADSAYHFWVSNCNIRAPEFSEFFQNELGVDLKVTSDLLAAFEHLRSLSLKQGGQLYQLLLSPKAMTRWTVPTNPGGELFQYKKNPSFALNEILMSYRQANGELSEQILSTHPRNLHNGGSPYKDIQARLFVHPDFQHLSSEHLIVRKYAAHEVTLEEKAKYEKQVEVVADLILVKLLTASNPPCLLSKKFQINGVDRLQHYYRNVWKSEQKAERKQDLS